jgi:dTDP-4-dehydrorhamnose reductase
MAIAEFLILGGHGMLGRALTAATSRRHTVAAMSHHECDITREADVASALDRIQPAAVFNCAAFTRVDDCETNVAAANALNGEAVGTLARLTAARRIRLVHFSTDYIFDGKTTLPYRETDLPDPLSAYGRSKLLGERELRKAGDKNWLLIRTAWLFGRHGRCFPRSIVERARRGEPLQVVSDQFGSPTLADDLADATLDLVDRRATGVWHIVNSEPASWFDLAAATLQAFGLPANIDPITTTHWQTLHPDRAVRPAFSVLDATPLATLRGHPLRSWREAVAAFAAQVRAADAF